MDITWRPITSDDVPAWNRLMARAEEVDQTGEHYNEADLAEELADPATGPDDRLAGWIGGRVDDMVAFTGVRPRESVTDHWRIEAEGTVDPVYRGRGLAARVSPGRKPDHSRSNVTVTPTSRRGSRSTGSSTVPTKSRCWRTPASPPSTGPR